MDISRRHFVGLVGGGVLALRGVPLKGATRYRVGVVNASDAYDGAVRALDASAEFPDVANRTVLVKPNLVAGKLAETGITTDPQAVRAVVDRALAGGASQIKIVEGGLGGAAFDECGYGFFRTYDARVSLVDLSTEPVTFAAVPQGTPPSGTSGAPPACKGIYLPTVVLEPGTVFVSVGKMKTHSECTATLSLKNGFGLPPIGPYLDPLRENVRPRFQLHDRSPGQVVVDIALARPIDYAVVDGVFGLEGNGPVDISGGTTVQSNVMVAGANALAVDLVCLNVMGIPRESTQYLEYAYLRGLGPFDLTQIDIAGDTVQIPPFVPAVTPPAVWFPKVVPTRFSPARGEKAAIYGKLVEPAQIQVQVLRTSDQMPSQTVVRTLQPWIDTAPGTYRLEWDGRDDAGLIVPPSLYAVRVQGRRQPSDRLLASGINWAVTT